MEPMRIREETTLHIHITTSPSNPIFFIYNATVPSGCNTLPSALMGGKKTQTNQFSSSASSWQSVAMDIQCGCMFRDQSDTAEARANQRRTSRSSVFPEVNRGHLGNQMFSARVRRQDRAPTIFQVEIGPRKRRRSGRLPLPSPLSHYLSNSHSSAPLALKPK